MVKGLAKGVSGAVLLLICFSLISLLIRAPLAGSEVLVSAGAGVSNSRPECELDLPLRDLNISHVMQHVKFFSSLKTRVLGYPDYYRAADYIINYFRSLNMNVTIHTFKTVMPIDEGSYMIVKSSGNRIKVYALWPSGGIGGYASNVSGKLYYVGRGEWDDLIGVNMSEAIVLMEFNSGTNYLRALSLGAKAIIFLEPEESDKFEALTKGASVPLNTPLFYATREFRDCLMKLAANHSDVTLVSGLKWREVIGKNIIAVLPGEQRDDVILVTAHYDSWSIVPSLSPAAEESLSISSLLELARLLSTVEHRRTIWFVAFSGYWEGLVGPAEFVEDVIFNTSARIWLQVDLDVSTETPFVDVMFFNIVPQAAANFMTYFSSIAANFLWIQKVSADELSRVTLAEAGLPLYANATTLNDLVKYNFVGYYWGTQPDLNYFLASAPLVQASGKAITLRTQYARRLHWFTPLNDSRYICWEHVKPQLYVAALLVSAFANREDLGVSYDSVRPMRYAVVAQAVLGYATLYGRTVEFDYQRGWYKPVPKAIVRLRVIPYDSPLLWPFAYRYTLSDDNGSFVFHGLSPLITWSLDAWKLSEEGTIEYYVDFGYMGTSQGLVGGISTSVYVLGTTASVLVPLFKGVSMTVFNIFDYDQMLRSNIPDIRSPERSFFYQPIQVRVFDSLTRAPPIHYFYASDSFNGIVLVAVPRGSRVHVLVDVGFHAWPLFVFTNSTKENPDGEGILLNDNLNLFMSERESMKNLLIIVSSRYEKLKQYEVKSPYLDYILEKAKEYSVDAARSAVSFNWPSYYANATLALNLLYKGYAYSLMPLYNEASLSMVILAFLILPFSILVERVLLRWSSWRRIVAIVGIAASLFAIFGVVHPALSVMANAAMAVFGSATILLVALAIAVLVREGSELARLMKVAKIGFHEYRGGAVAAALYTIETAADNIRYRPLRSALALLTITIITSGLVALSSTTYSYSLALNKVGAKPLLEGLLVRKMYGFPPESTGGGVLDVPMLSLFEAAFARNYIVSPRVWCYPTYVFPVGDLLVFSKPGNLTAFYVLTPAAIMGLSEEEARYVLAKYFVSEFTGLDEGSIVLPAEVAQALGLKVGDKVYLWGFGNFTVSGILALREQIYDSSGYPWLPIDPGFSTSLSLSGFTYPAGMTISPVAPTNVVFVNWRVALKFGGFISSIAMIPRTSEESGKTLAVAAQIADSLPLGGYASVIYSARNESYSVGRIFSVLFSGGMYLIVIVIATLTILNFMIGIVHERRREIMTYQALGLSPRGAFLLFSTEAATIAFGGALMGYLLGLALNKAFIRLGVLPQDFSFNFVSMTIYLSLLLVVAVTLAASLYPASLAARMVTPSYERRWRPDTRPQDGIWEVNFPIALTRDEAIGLLRYLHEFFREEGFVGSGYRVLEIGDISKEHATFELRVVLTPVETGITQDVKFYCREMKGRYALSVHIKLVAGDVSFFESRNLRFLDTIRKQILVWTSLPAREKQKYLG